ncbi:hypothetical protein DRO56_02070 [Candidatus Bathyarchaeota archaeon]|nr:MAG: hypothetical protein DRO56_02070 [Candidatus Bathyarchaeota archaeon]
MAFPFSAIVNQEKVKFALLINLVNPRIGGLLIRGPKGTGKTLCVRALEDILPEIEVVSDCPFNCNPRDPTNMCEYCKKRAKEGKLPVERRKMRIVNLPLGATEDRVVGSLDVEKAIKEGLAALKPGILAEANQNILYVDEINLLPDHIVDDLLDAAATGWNVVEREGVSVSHPSRFILIGTMNPEEGELRPQLLDRLPLSVSPEPITSPEERVEIVKRNLEFESDPIKFYKKYEKLQEKLRERIIKARELLPKVKIPEPLFKLISQMCIQLKVDGLRADISICKTASTLAAMRGRTIVNEDDIITASEFVLQHRTRAGGFMEPASREEIMEALIQAKSTIVAKSVTTHGDANSKGNGGDENGASSPLNSSGRGAPSRETINWARPDLWRDRKGKKEEFKNIVSEHGVRKDDDKRQLPFIEIPIFEKIKRLLRTTVYFTRNLPSAFLKFRNLVQDKTGKTFKKFKGGLQLLRASPLLYYDLFQGSSIIWNPEAARRALNPPRLPFKLGRRTRGVRSRVGKRATSLTSLDKGRIIGWRFPGKEVRNIHLSATIRAAALRGVETGSRLRPLEITFQDIREKLLLYKAPITIVLVVDLSESMITTVRALRSSILRLCRDAYLYRDKIGIVAMKKKGALIVQWPTTDFRTIAESLMNFRVSGLTPLAAGMYEALKVLKAEKRRNDETIPLMIIVTDGFANVPLPYDPRTNKPRPFILTVSSRAGIMALEDVVAISHRVRKEGIHVVLVNPDPYSGSFKVDEEEVKRIYTMAIRDGKFHGGIFLRELRKRWDSLATGLVICNLIAYLTKGKIYLIPSRRSEPDLLQRILKENVYSKA